MLFFKETIIYSQDLGKIIRHYCCLGKDLGKKILKRKKSNEA